MFPTGWFYIQANTHPHHVLTVVDKSWQVGSNVSNQGVEWGIDLFANVARSKD